jgi:hypothetical protein
MGSVSALLEVPVLADLPAKRSRMTGAVRPSPENAGIPDGTSAPARPVNLSGAPRDQLPDAKQGFAQQGESPMSRKSILAIAAVFVLGMSTLVATDASARGGGGGGGHFGGGGGHFSGGGARGGSVNRAAFHPGRVTTARTTNRSIRYNRGSHFTHNRVTRLRDPHRFHHNHWWAWCRLHHHHHCGYGIGVGVYGETDAVVVADAPRYVAPTPVAAVCNNDCDYFLNDSPGCYMAKRKFSTPQGDELRCVKICDEPEAK